MAPADVDMDELEKMLPQIMRFADTVEDQIVGTIVIGLAYWAAARLAHRFRLAAAALSSASASPTTPPVQVKMPSRKKLALFCVVAFAFNLGFQYLVIRIPLKYTTPFFSVAVGLIIGWFVYMFLILNPIRGGLVQWEVSKDTRTGNMVGVTDAFRMSINRRRAGKVVAAALATVYTVLALTSAGGPLKHGVILAFITVMGALPFHEPVSMRNVVWSSVGLEAFVVLATMFGAAVAYFAPDTRAEKPKDGITAADIQRFATIVVPASWMLRAAFVGIQGRLIAICWRLDYARRAPSSSPDPVIEIRKDGAEGKTYAAVPTSSPMGFAKPYFTTSLLISLAAYFLSAIFVRLPQLLPPEDQIQSIHPAFDVFLEEILATLLFLLVAPVVSIGAVFGLATWRDEVKAVWTYDEKAGASGADAVPQADVETAREQVETGAGPLIAGLADEKPDL